MTVEALARKAVKAAALPAGLLAPRRTGDVVILLYHRVGAGGREVDLPVSTFRRQLEALQRRERVLSLEDALRDGTRGGVVVSFDDGYSDFHEHALPVLEEFKIPAILYLATALVEGETGEAAPEGALTWSQLREATQSGLVTIGSHTHSHMDLSTATETEVQEEMRRSKESIEDRLGIPCRHFAYPFATGSVAADRAVRQVFDSAALHAWRTNRTGRTDRYRLGRTPVLQGDGLFFFRAKVRGLLDGEAVAYRWLRRGPWRQG
jgi:peptidoglycan/xylan/chitin deacetylase (PgdA/CDA1 family)